AQFLGDGGRLAAVEHDPAERLPGAGLEMGLDQLQEAAGDVPVVLALPQPARVAGRVLELVEHLQEVAVAGGLRRGLAVSPGGAEAVGGGRNQPAPSTP